jgi:hypothetical protein
MDDGLMMSKRVHQQQALPRRARTMRLPLLWLLPFLASVQGHLWGRPNVIVNAALARSTIAVEQQQQRSLRDEAVMQLVQRAGRGGSTTGTCSHMLSKPL